MEKIQNKVKKALTLTEGLSHKEIIDDYYYWQQEEAKFSEQNNAPVPSKQSEDEEKEFGEADILEDIYYRLKENNTNI